MIETVRPLTLEELLDKYPPQEKKIDSDTYLGAKTPIKVSAIVSRDEEHHIVFVVPGSAKFIQGPQKTETSPD